MGFSHRVSEDVIRGGMTQDPNETRFMYVAMLLCYPLGDALACERMG